LYKHSSGALVFGAGTVQWAWGLDINHDRGTSPDQEDPRMQQATVNLLADMGVQPGTLQSGLGTATASSDTAAPTSVITSPSNNATLSRNASVTIRGTAGDTGGGVVGGVEVSVDGGTTWHPATGRASWTYAWTTPSTSGTVSIRSRAVDDSGNLQTQTAAVTVNVR
ncbi:MAG TPA: Ig-like domain-containing protein, partial [Burkholderiaceae bacterium]|nr:Ig-like domain-containing protein [Burkholderiaceae bacterium]